MKTIRLGSGAGFAGDRLEPALDLLERGNLDYMAFECLAERTIALAQLQKMKDPETGYNELLAYRMKEVLPRCARHGVRIITNMGAANPMEAARVTRALAESLGLGHLRILAVLGDDVLDGLSSCMDEHVMETGESLDGIKDRIVSANAYLGAEGILQALQQGADVVITGRVSDTALFVGPLRHAFGWSADDPRLGQAILAGHLLECAAQVTGGYFADPGCKDVPDLAHVGFPLAEVSEDGEVIITKLPGTGGCVTEATCKEQLLYEIHDPAAYLTPDGVADYTGVTVQQVAQDRVRVIGARWRPGNGRLKVSVGYRDGYIGEGSISYGGSSAAARARMAGQILHQRLVEYGVPHEDVRVDRIGVDALYGGALSARMADARQLPAEVRLRVAVRTESHDTAERVGYEVEALYLNGPAGGGGVERRIREILSVASILIPEQQVHVTCTRVEGHS